MTDNCDMNLFDPENMEIKPGNINLFIPEGSKMTVSASVDSLYCIGLRASDRDIDLKMSEEQAVKLARGILTLSGEERPQGEWIDYDNTFYKCPDCGYLLEKCCPQCQNKVILPKDGADMQKKQK